LTGAYNHIGGKGIVHAACWAHARRKFCEAVKLLNLIPKIRPRFRSWQINELFAIDAQARQKGLSPMERHILRLEKAKPLLEQIKVTIQAARGSTLPKSALEGLRLHVDALDSAQSFPGISGVGTLLPENATRP
jgi:transposase